MNLSKLFEIQAELDKSYQDVPDRLSKDILWLMTELGELANEWRGFRYRRPEEEQTPRTEYDMFCGCHRCEGHAVSGNPLLEEYTDALSVLLSIGLQEYEMWDSQMIINMELLVYGHNAIKYESPLKQFSRLFDNLGYLEDCIYDHEIGTSSEVEEIYRFSFRCFLGLGELLGFSWDQIETAYMEKAEANKRRNAHA